MSDVKRIDPQQVAAWFQAHPEIEPIRGAFSRGREVAGELRLSGCCGITTQVLEAGSPPLAEWSRIARVLGLNAKYVKGFMDGWDDRLPESSRPGLAYLLGASHGKEAYTATLEALRP